MNNLNPGTRKIAVSGIVGAIYAVLTIALAPFSYGAVQMRVSELLCILPFFIPSTVWGLTLGCAAANIMTGNIFDIVFGSLATFGAGLMTAWLGKKGHSMKNSVLACLMPVLFNAFVIGAVITGAYSGLSITDNLGVFAINALYVGLGEATVMFALGLPIMRYLPKQKFFREYVGKLNS